MEIYVAGLRNAHAMENQALAIMHPQVSRIKHYPEMAERLDQHVVETEGQLTRLDRLLDKTGSSHSSLKDTALSIGGTLAALGHSMAPDEIVKNSFANFAFENYEIAAYKSLLALAEQVADDEAISLLQHNLDEEIAMSEWLDSAIEPLTLRYASLSDSATEAKK
ncbi:ferritin-like domain-containing protein [Devosia chinhatensis]|uniref:ferritin-like domain-containing protein n=1 Tax=Devosia chinhatensis TaxID=429727 RepID=UPI0031398B49